MFYYFHYPIKLFRTEEKKTINQLVEYYLQNMYAPVFYI